MSSCDEYEAILDFLDSVQADDADDPKTSTLYAATDHGEEILRQIAEDVENLYSAIQRMKSAPVTKQPEVVPNEDGTADWTREDGSKLKLKEGQYKAFGLLREAGNVQLKVFLSGEGGVRPLPPALLSLLSCNTNKTSPAPHRAA